MCVFAHVLAGTIREHRTALNGLKLQNKQLKEELAGWNANKAAVAQVEKDVHQLRGSLDTVLQDKNRASAKLANVEDELRVTQVGPDVAYRSDVDYQTLRLLENRLDKAILQRNEAVSLQKSLQQMVTRLALETAKYDSQLEELSGAIDSKELEISQQQLQARQAQHAKQQAANQLPAVQQECKQKQASLEASLQAQRRKFGASVEGGLQLPSPSTADGGGGDGPAADLKAVQQLLIACCAPGVPQLVTKLKAEHARRAAAAASLTAAREKLQAAQSEHRQLKQRQEELQEGRLASSSQRQAMLDAAESEHQSAAKRADKWKEKSTAISRVLVNVRAGAEQLNTVAALLPSMSGALVEAGPLNNGNLLESVRAAGQRISATHDMLKRSPQSMARLHDLLESMDCC